jgi:hypothetical protein
MSKSFTQNIAQINRDINKITRDLKGSVSKINGAVNRAMVKEGNTLRNVIITSMRNTPLAPWFYRSGKNRTIVHHPSRRGKPPAIDSGELVRAIVYDVENMRLEVGALAGTAVTKGGRSYAEILETTKNKKLSRPWLNPAVESRKKEMFENIKRAIFKEFKDVV